MESSDELIVNDTYNATIYCGFRPGYESFDTSEINIQKMVIEAKGICQQYCDDVGFCVTVERTSYHYKDGWEDGVRVGLINYPRFNPGKELIREHALQLAKMLKEAFEQKRVSIVFSDVTATITNKDNN